MSVDPDRVREIFDAAARLPKEQQAAYLATACDNYFHKYVSKYDSNIQILVSEA